MVWLYEQFFASFCLWGTNIWDLFVLEMLKLPKVPHSGSKAVQWPQDEPAVPSCQSHWLRCQHDGFYMVVGLYEIVIIFRRRRDDEFYRNGEIDTVHTVRWDMGCVKIRGHMCVIKCTQAEIQKLNFTDFTANFASFIRKSSHLLYVHQDHQKTLVCEWWDYIIWL